MAFATLRIGARRQGVRKLRLSFLNLVRFPAQRARRFSRRSRPRGSRPPLPPPPPRWAPRHFRSSRARRRSKILLDGLFLRTKPPATAAFLHFASSSPDFPHPGLLRASRRRVTRYRSSYRTTLEEIARAKAPRKRGLCVYVCGASPS